MALIRGLPFVALALLAGCDSKVTSTTLNEDLQARFETLSDCFPDLWRRANALLTISGTWRQQGGVVPDPAGLTWEVEDLAGETAVKVTYLADGVTIAMAIKFFAPSGGNGQDILADITGRPTLNETIRAAANKLRDDFPGQQPFMVGEYEISGGGVAGDDALTGIIGGSTNQNELEELRTTLGYSPPPSGGPPAVDPATISETAPPNCVLTFTIPDLRTDESPTQQYPIGTVALTLQREATTVNATITFNGTATAVIAVDGIDAGDFTFNIDTRTLTFRPE